MTHTGLLHLAVLGLVVGGVGGLLTPGGPARRVGLIPVIGAAGAMFGGLLGQIVMGTALPGAHLGFATVICLLIVGGYTLRQRMRNLPR